MSELTPREIVAELDKYIIGQNQAKRMVAIAVRNRWRRQRLAAELRNEVAPRNIIMMGPTGVGKTEIARRLAKLCSAPFIKVEATKYTEVGYVGRDVESMIRDLMEIGINLVRAEEAEKVKGRAEAAAEERLLDLLLPSGDGRENTREKLRELFRQGFLDDREVEFEVKEQSQPIGMLGVPGMEQLGDQMKGAFSKLFPQKTHRKKMKVGAAWRHLIEDESAKLVDEDKITDLARERVEQMGIVFIDEIDAVGRARGKNVNMNSNDERENTLNQLLTEMDGFGSNSGVIILAATNRADILDKALLRAGRFDRQIHVELPDLNERKEIFGVHLRPIKIDESVDAEFLARQTPGFSGADIANVCNEAALIAARNGKKFVQKEDFMNAVDRIVGGLEKRTKITTADERQCIANHEAGHATLSWLLEHANPLVKVTIVPRGKALGAAWYLPEERQITTREQLLDEMCATLGGRAAEELFLGKISTGASNDLERVTKQAYAMVVYFGMSNRLPNLNYYDSSGQDWGFTKPYSEETARMIDQEVQAIINEQYERAKSILKEYASGHNMLAQVLLEREVIYTEDVEHIFGKRAWVSRSEEILELQEKANGKKAENQ